MSEDRIEALKQLLEQEPHDTMLLFGLGNELLSLGQYAEAIPYFEEAVRVDPEYAAVYVYLARAYEESNQPAWSATPWSVAGALLCAAATRT